MLGIHTLAMNKEMQVSCIRSVTLNPGIPPPTFEDIFRQYANPILTLSHQAQLLQTQNVDIHAFVVFGVVNNIISRVHKYPLVLANNTGIDPNGSPVELQELSQFVDGKHTFDEIATKLGKSYTEIQNFFSLSMYK